MAYTVLSGKAPSYDSQGWCEKTGMTCHTTLMAWVKNLETTSLEHVKQDCKNAIAAMPDGRKSGHYQDTIHYIGSRQTSAKYR